MTYPAHLSFKLDRKSVRLSVPPLASAFRKTSANIVTKRSNQLNHERALCIVGNSWPQNETLLTRPTP